MSFYEIWQFWCQTSNMCNLSRNARYVQSNGYFGGPLSLSLSSPLFRSLFRPSVSHFLLHFSFSFALLTSALVTHAHRLSTIPAFSWNYVEFMLHFCCIITGTCAMHARKSHISAVHGSKTFKWPLAKNKSLCSVSWRKFTRKTYATRKVKRLEISCFFQRNLVN